MFHREGDPWTGVWMLGAVGDDDLGPRSPEGAQQERRPDRARRRSRPDAPTGVALIAVGVDGENQISVAPGANAALKPSDVVGALETLQPHVVLVSLEVLEPTVRAALQWARDHDVTTILNPAPPQPWARDLLGLATYVTPNEHERSTLGAIPEGVVVIETRGAEGAVIHRPDGSEEPVPRAQRPGRRHDRRRRLLQRRARGRSRDGHRTLCSRPGRGPGRIALRRYLRSTRGDARFRCDPDARGRFGS